MPETTLVTLVGEQPIPVLLPIRALRASQVCYVHTERTKDVACRVAMLNPGIAARYVSVDPYDLQAIQTSLVAAVQALPDASLIFNLTGATKPMLLAAYTVAAQRGAEVVYLRTEGHRRTLRSVLYRYQLVEGQVTSTKSQPLGPLITLDDYLRAHVTGYREEGPSDTAGGPLEEAVAAALRGWTDEVMVGVRPEGVGDQVEIDALVRSGNQVAVLEVKSAGASGKDAVDQLTTAAAREYLGTYATRFVVVGQRTDQRYKALAQALRIRVVELHDGWAWQRATPRLSRADTQRLRQALGEVLPVQ